MPLHESGRLHVAAGELSGRVSLPPLPDARQWEPPLPDRVGMAVQSGWPLVVAGGIGGALAGSLMARRTGRGAVVRVLGGAAGALTGAGLAAGALAARAPGGAHEKRAARADALAPSTEVVARERVKVMTFNVHGGMGGPGAYLSSDRELDRIAEVIEREQPDIVLLQEADRLATRSSWTDTLAEIDARLDADVAVGASPITTVLGRDHHVAVMTFNGFSVESARNVVHPDPRGGGVGIRLGSFARDVAHAGAQVLGTEPTSRLPRYKARNTIDAMVLTPAGTHLRVLSGHHQRQEYEVDYQRRQVGALATALDSWRGPTIFGADFNVGSDNTRGARERRLLGRAGLHDAFLSAGIAPDDPARSTSPSGAMIDRIYHSGHAQVHGARVVQDDWSSDHRAVVAELELVPGLAERA